jgi:hypothetical protein
LKCGNVEVWNELERGKAERLKYGKLELELKT